jgi:hypothetical protein
LEWDISAQLFPSHWEFDSCAFGEWWWRELYLRKCYCTFGELTLNKTGGLQKLYNVSCDDLADEYLGAGSGWQQSELN